MPTVIISKNSQFERVFPFQDKIHIGRGLSNDIVLDTFEVSRVHAAIEQQGGQFFLIDEGSTNGTFIDNKRIQRHRLTNGTSFRIQNYLLAFVEDAPVRDDLPEDIGLATIMAQTQSKLMDTVWLPQQAVSQKGFQQKISLLLNMVRDLITAPIGADTGALVLNALFDITGAQRGMVALKKKEGEPTFSHIRGFDPKGGEALEAGRTLCKRVIGSGKSICMLHADKKTPMDNCLHGPESVLCMPLISGDQPIGCLYLDHPGQAGVFSKTDQDLFAAAAEDITEAFLQRTTQPRDLAAKDERLANSLKSQGIIAQSPNTLKVFRDCSAIAQYNVSVLILGETGTGKEVIARYIHSQSGRKGKFIAQNCTAIAASMFESELFGHEKGAFTGATDKKLGLIELAHGGSLFLDEIGDMPGELQSKMLRAIQEQEIWRVGGKAPIKIDVRVLAATHKDIKKNRKQLNFRDDLYYRLANVEITAPGLRDRPEDIAPLCEVILKTFSAKHPAGKRPLSISPSALRLLEAYDWPGNIRELHNTLIQISLRCDGHVIEPRHLKGLIDVYAAPSKKGTAPMPSLSEVERDHIIMALKRTDWNKSNAAKVLSIDRNRLNRLINKHGIDKSMEN